MNITLKYVDYHLDHHYDPCLCTQNATSKAILGFVLDDGQNGEVEVLAFINQHAGEFGFGLFSGVGGDYSLLQELDMSTPVVKESFIRMAKSSHIDVDDKEAFEDYLLDVEATMRKQVPQEVWGKMKGRQNCG